MQAVNSRMEREVAARNWGDGTQSLPPPISLDIGEAATWLKDIKTEITNLVLESRELSQRQKKIKEVLQRLKERELLLEKFLFIPVEKPTLSREEFNTALQEWQEEKGGRKNACC